jgi:hypothetical protein
MRVRNALLFIIQTGAALAVVMLADIDREIAIVVIIVAAESD